MAVLYGLFWVSVLLLVYNYVLYPLILYAYQLRKRNRGQTPILQDLPVVTLIISAFNEAAVMNKKLQNAAELDYPAEKLEILVVSDASTDGTDEIVQRWAERDQRIQLLRMPERRGKTAGLNLAVARARGDVVIFSDANAMYEKHAIRELVRFFHDDGVGYVVGKAVYLEEDASPASFSENVYWKYELWIKKLESDFHSVVGGDGAIYAIRRHLFDRLHADDINDFVNPLQIVAKGYRGIFNPHAVCYEYAASDFLKEFWRKRRIVNRSWRAFKKYLKLFDIRKQWKFLFLLVSHKVIRWFNWVFLLTIYFTTIAMNLLSNSLFFRAVLALQVLFVLFSIIGYYLDKKGKPIPILFYLPYYYHLINLAAFLGIVDDLRGKKYVKWDHVRVNQS